MVNFLAFSAFLPLATIVIAQEPSKAVSLSSSIDVARLVDLASQRLGITIEYDPAVIKGTVTLRGGEQGAIADSDLWAALNGALAGRGFTTIVASSTRSSGVARPAFVVVRISEAANLVMPIGPFPNNLITWNGLESGYASIFLKVQYRQPKAIADLLKVVLSKTGSVVTPVGESDLLLVADLTPRLKLAVDFLTRIDTPQAPTELSEVVLTHVTPADVISFIKDMAGTRPGAAGAGQRPPGDVFAQPGSNSVLVLAPKEHLAFWKDLIARLDAKQAAETRNYTSKSVDAKSLAKLVEEVAGVGVIDRNGPKVIVDEFTGTLIVTATASQHAKVAELLSRIDSQPDGPPKQVKTYALRNRPVKEIVPILTELLTTQDDNVNVLLPSGEFAPVTVRRPTPAVPTSDRTRAQEVQVTSDEGTNTLIVIAEPRVLGQVEELLKTLDVRQPQVMIEVAMISLTEGQSRALGIELDKITTAADGTIRLSSIFSSTSGGGAPSGNPGTGLTASYINIGDFSAVLRAFEAVNNGRSASVPSVLVGNNQQATFSSVAQQPTGSISTDTTSTTTRGFGGFQDAGTRINVKPQIAEGDHLSLDYSVELSSFTSNPSSEGLPGARQQNTVSSKATIPDGHAVVVGGIEFKTDTEDTSRVPILGEIPLLGALFRTRTNGHDRTRFFVLIKANVMRDGGFEDLKYVSERTVDREGLGAAFETGWPKVEPRVIK